MAKRAKTPRADARDELQLRSDRDRVSEYYTQGYSLDEITTLMRVSNQGYTRETAATDLDAVREEWAIKAGPDAIAVLHEELRANETLLRSAWDNYRAAEANLGRADYIPPQEAIDENADSEPKLASDVNPQHRRAIMTMALSVRRQAFTELKMWWEAIVDLREKRARLLGLISSGMNITVDNRKQTLALPGGQQGALPPKVYAGFSPDEWDEIQRANSGSEVPVEAEYEEQG